MIYKLYEVEDCSFNQHHYPSLIGNLYTSPPSYARVRVIEKYKLKELWDGSVTEIATGRVFEICECTDNITCPKCLQKLQTPLMECVKAS